MIPVPSQAIGANISVPATDESLKWTSSSSGNPRRQSDAESSRDSSSSRTSSPEPAARVKPQRVGRISTSTIAHLSKKRVSESPTTKRSPQKKTRENVVYVDLVTPRAPRTAVKVAKGAGLPRVPLGDKSTQNTPLANRTAFAKNQGRKLPGLLANTQGRPSPTVKHKPGHRPSGKGLPPSPVQRKAPQKIEVIDYDSDGQTSKAQLQSTPGRPTNLTFLNLSLVNKEIRQRKPAALTSQARRKRIIISDDEEDEETAGPDSNGGQESAMPWDAVSQPRASAFPQVRSSKPPSTESYSVPTAVNI